MNRSLAASPTRGAARVSAVWLIVAFVLFLGAFVFGLIAYQDRATALEAAEAARADRTDAEASVEDVVGEYQELATVVGWYDPAAASKETNLNALGQALEDLRGGFPGLDQSQQTIAAMIPVMISDYNALARQLAERDQRIQSLEATLAAEQQSRQQIVASKDEEIRALQQQLSDAQDTAAQRQSELERRLAEAQAQARDRDQEARAAQQALAEQEREWQARLDQLRIRNQELVGIHEIVTNPDEPDAEVIGVSPELGIGVIDIGATDRLVVGTRFEVLSGTSTDQPFKGWAEVTAVKPNIAEVRFTNVVDPNNPISEGDVVRNPLYQPGVNRNAVLVGRFTAPYDETEMEALLERIGIDVQQSLSPTTHYLIVGDRMFTDEEGEPLEDQAGIDPRDLRTYKEAQAQSVVILDRRKVTQFFRF